MLGDGVTAVRPQDGALLFHHLMQGAFQIKFWSCGVPASLTQSLQ